MQETVRIHPSLAEWAIQKGNKVGGLCADVPYRAWLLLHYLGQREGTSGSIGLEIAILELAGNKGRLRIGGKRYLRKILRAGDGLFWTQAGGRLWLTGTKELCAKIGLTRLSGRPANVPLDRLCGSVPKVRAWLLAAIMGGRRNPNRPIARETIRKVTGVGRRTQRRYERQTKTKVEKNAAVAAKYTPYNLQRARLYQGFPAYRDGQNVCYPLPNSYRPPSEIRVSGGGATRALNKRIKRSINLETGNGRLEKRRYYGCPSSAYSAWSRGRRDSLTYGDLGGGKWAVFLLD